MRFLRAATFERLDGGHAYEDRRMTIEQGDGHVTFLDPRNEVAIEAESVEEMVRAGREAGYRIQRFPKPMTPAEFERATVEEMADIPDSWIHYVERNRNGAQPCDVIAVVQGSVFLLDCKLVSSGKTFRFSRCEENQRLAFERATNAGAKCAFLIRWPNGVRSMLEYGTLLRMEADGLRSVSLEEAHGDKDFELD